MLPEREDIQQMRSREELVYTHQECPRADGSTARVHDDVIAVAVQRKIAAGGTVSRSLARDRAATALDRILAGRFCGLVFDLDGTLVDKHGEQCPDNARHDLRAMLTRLADGGLSLAVATGRNPCRATVQVLRSLFPERQWENVLVGYCNGTQRAPLSKDVPEIVTPLVQGDFDRLSSVLDQRRRDLRPRVELVSNPTQLTLLSSESRSTFPQQLFALAQETIAETGARAKAVCSTRSVDIIHLEGSKLQIADILGREKGGSVLRFGDLGAWPGSDFELLADPFGLSVNQVSSDLEACWNLLPSNTHSVDGTIYYLERLDFIGTGIVRFRRDAFEEDAVRR